MEPEKKGDDVSATPDMGDLGPLQMLVVAFPGNRFRGEILPELDRLKRQGIIRVIDLLIVRKDRDGNVMTAVGSDLDFTEATSFGAYAGGLAGLIAGGPAGFEKGALAGAAELADGHVFDEEDVFRVTQSLPRDTTAVLMLLEHVWVRPLLGAVERAGGLEIANEWVAPQGVLTLDDQLRSALGTPPVELHDELDGEDELRDDEGLGEDEGL